MLGIHYEGRSAPARNHCGRAHVGTGVSLIALLLTACIPDVREDASKALDANGLSSGANNVPGHAGLSAIEASREGGGSFGLFDWRDGPSANLDKPVIDNPFHGTSPGDTGDNPPPDTGVTTDCEFGTPRATGPNLWSARRFVVLGGSTVTNTGASVLVGNLGTSPGRAITGFPPGVVVGSTHRNDAEGKVAQIDLGEAYWDAATRAEATPLPADVSGFVLGPGVYRVRSSLQIASADLRLDGQGDPNATWIFQIASTLVTLAGADVLLTDCAQSANVFWQVGSSATIGVGTDFVGTVMADQSITAKTAASVDGRLLARVGAVTLDTNLVVVP